MPKQKIQFNTGELTAEELEGIFTALPVDVSFIDQDDIDRFYNQNGQRIFPRTDAALGRQVQACHPPKSLGKVSNRPEEQYGEMGSNQRPSCVNSVYAG